MNAIFSKMAALVKRVDRSFFDAYAREHRGAPLTEEEWQVLAQDFGEALLRFRDLKSAGYPGHEFVPWLLEQRDIPGPYGGKWKRAERGGTPK